ncbi:hypothetical protein FRB96_000979 [Tulasnella sp. 330]|nr:hypothetical protein FRB96_000979 [Tulasnella sp. 330]
MADSTCSHPLPNIPVCHRCLLIEEILQCIFSDLPRHGLAQVTLVCKAWLDPALNTLWEKVDLDCLLNVLSPTCVQSENLEFTRRLSEGAWARFHDLAPRIRTLNNENNLGTRLSSELYLTNSNPPPLLPNLRNLRWHVEPTSSLAFIGPQLRRLHLNMTGSPSPVFYSLAAPALSHNLECIEIYDHYRYRAGKADAEPLAEMLRLLLGLRRAIVVMRADLGPVLVALYELPKIEEIEIICHTVSIPAIPASLDKSSPSVRRLKLEARESMSGIPALLDHTMDSSSLSKIVLGESRKGCRLGDLRGVMESLGRHRGLCSIILNADRNPSSITGDVLNPICRCNCLEILKVYVDGSLAITDGELRSLVSGLTKLREIALWGNMERPVPLTNLASLTINSLGIVTKSCPSITQIYFSPLDASGHNLRHPSQPSRTLHTIHVGRSTIRDVHAVATFLESLSDMEILTVFSGWDHSTEQDVLWKEAEALVLTLKRRRAQEGQMVQPQNRT